MEDNNVVDAIPHLNRYALYLTRNKADADDLVSITILAAIELIRSKNLYIQKPKSFLAGMMRNLFVSKFCRSKHRRHLQLDTLEYGTPARQDNVVYLLEVERKINKLPFNEKRVITALVDGLTAKDISMKFRGYRTGIYAVRKIIQTFQENAA